MSRAVRILTDSTRDVSLPKEDESFKVRIFLNYFFSLSNTEQWKILFNFSSFPTVINKKVNQKSQ